MSAAEYEKNPDIAVHCIEITDEMRAEVLDHFASIVEAAEKGEPPALDIEKWTFNNFKTACALSLSDEELTQLERQVAAIQRSGLPDWKKRQYTEALEQIRKLREVA
ncbi:hypothetical protein PACILC2_22320 [Paenibacillus cisolokensis]|uniref:Uncharacterized protein n=1 Tax=Paenibacillus cisolokensis TaxID=1658519 RepID=A0ABQ4N693_9BACL|nr:hypothetical protein [Paenibacillus cisolokensis]GIQ63664.1 hypothetical protein PACILC2_22320 [Paenibacillus cisolokensis]